MSIKYAPRKINTTSWETAKRDLEREFRSFISLFNQLGEATPTGYAGEAIESPYLGMQVLIYKEYWIPEEVTLPGDHDVGVIIFLERPILRTGTSQQAFRGQWYLLNSYSLPEVEESR